MGKSKSKKAKHSQKAFTKHNNNNSNVKDSKPTNSKTTTTTSKPNQNGNNKRNNNNNGNSNINSNSNSNSNSNIKNNHNNNNHHHDSDTHFPLPFPSSLPRPTNDFLRDEEPYKKSFQMALKTSYEGFVVDDDCTLFPQKNDNKNNTKNNLNEETIQQALGDLLKHNYFRTDVTQPFGLGTKCAKTYVTRCLLGEFGTTYKYLGLRMFAHPWNTNNTIPTTMTTSSSNKIKNNNSSTSLSSTTTAISTDSSKHVIYALSQKLSDRTKYHLQELDKVRQQRNAFNNNDNKTKGRHVFDICLINRMEATSDLKPEPTMKNAKTSVSWHADSSLEHYSTIAVYQTIVTMPTTTTTTTATTKQQAKQQSKAKTNDTKNNDNNNKNSTNTSWLVALRVAHNSEGPNASRRGTDIDSSIVKETPPIAACLPSGSAYYMLDDFNHHHQHTVLTTANTSVPNDNTTNNNHNNPKKNKKRKKQEKHHDHDDVNVENNVAGSNEHISNDKTKQQQQDDDDDNNAGIRYSCTYRLLRDSHNVNHMIARCKTTCSHFHKKGSKVWRSEQLLLTEMESEWIRQFYIQGLQHYELLWPYWGEPIKELLRYWSQLENRTKQVFDFLRLAAEAKCHEATTIREESTPSSASSSLLSRAERKLRERRKKALISMEDVLKRSNNLHHNDNTSNHSNNNSNSTSVLDNIYNPMAELLDERAEMRHLWSKREHDHVFHELAKEYRPMDIPIKFECPPPSDEKAKKEKDNNSTSCNWYGVSPLKGSPEALKEMASMLRAYGRAYETQNVQDLPTKTTNILNDDTNNNDDDDDDKNKQQQNVDTNHSKSLDWFGWDQYDFGLELQEPWADAVVTGKKPIETRAYDLPPALLGKRIMIIQSPAGTAGVSAMGNVIELKKSSNGQTATTTKIIGWCIFSSVKKYTSQQEFEKDEQKHLVTRDSGYGWKHGKTKIIYGWIVEKYGKYDDSNNNDNANGNATASTDYDTAVRRMRSLFQVKANNNNNVTNQNGKRSHPDQKGKSRNNSKNTKNKNKKRRKRY